MRSEFGKSRGVSDLFDGKKSIFTRAYWREAARQTTSLRVLVFAALIVALRVVVKLFRIPIAAGLYFTFDCYVNAVGSLIYGPVVALLVGAVSDTLGCIIAPTGPYFFPYIFVEMASSFIFALFFWRKRITVFRTLAAKGTVNLVCNIVMTPIIQDWYYSLFDPAQAEKYHLITLVRVGKNIVLFPLEAVVIVAAIGAFLPVLKSAHVVPADQERPIYGKRDFVLTAVIFVVSVGIVLAYIFWGKAFLSEHNLSLL